MKIPVHAREHDYDIVLRRGALRELDRFTDIRGKALIVTDSGVPEKYARSVASQLKNARIHTVPQGEQSKSFSRLEEILTLLLREGFTRSDCVIACGGGVVGDLSGFAAACYMRGIDFYNIPTTVLSQVDSSVGGKTAVNLGGIKNPVGAFHAPRAVIIDPDVLDTLDDRQLSNGLAEAVKMSLTSDEELFRLIETHDVREDIESILFNSLMIKRSLVELDERESGARRLLNFGHTIGHAIEAMQNPPRLYHGECVGLGMLPMCSDEVRDRLLPMMKRLGLPRRLSFDEKRITEAIRHDKKAQAGRLYAVTVEKPGEGKIVEMSLDEIEKRLQIIREEDL